MFLYMKYRVTKHWFLALLPDPGGFGRLVGTISTYPDTFSSAVVQSYGKNPAEGIVVTV